MYNDEIINYAANISRIGSLPKADASARAVSRLCGSEIEVDISFEQDKVSAFAHRVAACLLGQASAAVVAEAIVGSSKTELRALIQTARAMLREQGAPPQGRFAALKILQSMHPYKTRHPSMLLVFDALEDCLNAIEQKEHAHG